ITTSLGAASGSLVETLVRGQWGFRHHSPSYLHAEAGWSGIPSAPRNNSPRLGGELGYEGRHLRRGFRVGSLSYTGTEAATLRSGGYLFYRVVSLARLWGREEDLSREDRQHLIRERIKRRENEIALAPLIFGEFDTYDTTSDLEGGTLRTERI